MVVENVNTMKDAKITFKIDSELKKELTTYAQLKKKTLSSFLADELALQLRGYFIRCRKCKRPMFDTREVILTGKTKVKCQHCGFEFEVDFDDR